MDVQYQVAGYHTIYLGSLRFHIGFPVVQAGWLDGQSRDHQNFLDGWITKFCLLGYSACTHFVHTWSSAIIIIST